MAECDVCESEPLAFIVGNAETGEQQFLGPACFARLGLEIAKAILPAEEIASTLGPLFVDLPSGAAGEAAGGRKRKPAGKPSTEQESAPRAAEGTAEASAAAEDG